MGFFIRWGPDVKCNSPVMSTSEKKFLALLELRKFGSRILFQDQLEATV